MTSPEELDALAARVHELEEAIFWACGVVGDFAPVPDGGGVLRPFWWRKELRERAGISDEALNTRILDAQIESGVYDIEVPEGDGS